MFDNKLFSPKKTDDASISVGYKTEWACLYFGSYPQSEIVGDSFDSVNREALSDGDVIFDATLFSRLKAADWQDGCCVIDGKRYCRITGKDAVTAFKKGRHHYRWHSTDEFHYFLFEPVKWRVLERRDGVLTLMADKALDCRRYNETPGDVSWETSSLRAWLNGEFMQGAFNEDERACIVKKHNVNAPNSSYGTSSGNDTDDYVYILSDDEVFASETATTFGFYNGSGMDDAGKRFRSTTFAKCRGTWWSPVDFFEGNAFWLTRTSGYRRCAVTYICDLGYIYPLGTAAICDDSGIIPVINIREDARLYKYAGSVFSKGIPKEMEVPDIENAEQVIAKYAGRKSEYITFGSYPQSEIVPGDFTAVDGYALCCGDYITDKELYDYLETAEWTDNELTLSGVRYRRISSSDISALPSKDSQHYRYDKSKYHYFKYEPIRWRVLTREDGRCLLMSTRAIECRIFNENSRHVSWETSSLRAFLNGEFFLCAFSKIERERILNTKLENKENRFFKVYCGEDTFDRVFLLSEGDVLLTERAVRYGFSPYSYINDDARKIHSTAYAKFMGAWWSPQSIEKGTGFWFLRTSGYTTSNIMYVAESGNIYNRGAYACSDDGGIVPAIWIKE